jgi:Tfp pilus assembly protein PilO
LREKARALLLLFPLCRVRDELGAAGMAALALLAFSALFLAFVLKPLEARNARLAAELERHAGLAAQGQPGAAAQAAASKLDTFYRYLGRGEAPTDWLAKLYGIAKATGIEMQSATYKTQAAGKRMERYEIVLPVSGSYLQLRDFLKRALAEIPVLSLDQMSLKREARNEGEVQAELHLTLHLVKP